MASLPQLIENVSLVVSELATNAVVHAHTPFTVRLSCENGSLVLTVRDGSTSAVFVRPPTPWTPEVGGCSSSTC